MEVIRQNEPFTVVGIELKTSNENAFTDIPQHWARFFGEGVLQQIANRASDDIYAVYTNFPNEGRNNEGVYSFIIGARVTDATKVAAPFVAADIAEAKHRVFTVPAGEMHKVGEKWQEIWGIQGLEKTFVADFERYGANGEIEILVGVK